MINPQEFRTLRKEFNKIDTNGSGTIEIEELKLAVRKWHVKMSEAELEKIVKELDIYGSGVINYHQFIAATFPVEKYATHERIQSLFQKFDTKGEGKDINVSTLSDAFTKLGHRLGQNEIDEIMQEHGVDRNHEITFKEFELMILDHM